MLVFLASINTGCFATGHSGLERGDALDRVTGVTTRSGEEIRFATTGATVRNDTLFAVGKRGQVMVPVDSIALVSTRQFSALRTAGLIGAVAGAAFLALVIVAYDNFNIP